MVNKNFVRLNINDEYLSLGNLFRVIKERASNPNAFLQSDLFSIIFNTENIADSTVNNYCTGLRAINPKYKKYFQDLKNSFENDNTVFIPIVSKILMLIESTDFCNNNEYLSQNQINSNSKLKHICNRLYSISKNDMDVSVKLSNELYKNLEENNLYNFFVKVLFYVVLEKQQPIYVHEKLNNVIEKNIYNTNLSIDDIQNYINLQLNSGIWSIRGIKNLAEEGNSFACFEMASMEFYGIITGKPRYEKAFEYYKIAASHNHPVANWAIGFLYYNGYIGTRSKRDLYFAFKYFNKSRNLKCSNAFNSIGLMFLNGDVKHIKQNKISAINMFETAISMGNIYAYNNLGQIYENEKDYKKAYSYYIVSADLGESWSANKIGEFYRTGVTHDKDLKRAFKYYKIASDSPKFTLCKWSKYNLAKYFYEDGNLEAGIKQDLHKTIELLDEVSDDLLEASKELIYIYYKLYLKSNKKENYYLNKLMVYKEKCEQNPNYNAEIKKEIETVLLDINNKFSDKIQIIT